ncbi:SDR family NAD(P)-dependent oxidoreductase [Leptospira sp. SA-E8]|uniref:SDR family NAD(P)-dependent oxidoreductase n=1 Tax=Leptospira sp. SA-E8 TaxID=3422259 RepID=UPI003EBA4194
MAKRALITGATAGIGKAFARALARQGWNLVIVSRDAVRMDALASELRQQHGIAVDVVAADLTTSAGLATATAAVRDAARPIDLLVNNAGASIAQWFGDTSITDEDWHLDLLVRAPMHLMDAALKTMSARTDVNTNDKGAILNVASVAAFALRGTYSAHKAWLVNLSHWAHFRYKDRGVHVMALCPGFARTEFHQRGKMDTSGIPDWMWLDADRLVADALKDLARKKAISVPSLRYKLLAFLSRNMPSFIVAAVARRGR